MGLLGAGSGYVYASVTEHQLPTLLPFLTARAEARLAQAFGAAQQLVDDPQLEAGGAWYEARKPVNQTPPRENATVRSMVEFTGGTADRATNGAKAPRDQNATFPKCLPHSAQTR